MQGRETAGGGRGGEGSRNGHAGTGRDANKPVSLKVYTHYDKGLDYQAQGADDHLKMLKISYADYSQRPARKQVEEAPGTNLQAPEGCNEYNIWYGRWLGEQWKESKELIAAQTRCCVRRDAGRTKAEDRNWAGTGNFNRMNKTLYIGGLKMLRGPEATHKSLLRHFSEWGEVEQLRLIPSKAIAFVTFKLRACAEFALEAMHCQTLDLDELLNIRWAYEDPNPRAQAVAREKLELQLIEALEKKGVDLSDVDYSHPNEYKPDYGPEAKRQRIEGPALGIYPETDTQYAYLSGQAAAAPAADAGDGEAGPRVQTKEEMEREAEAARAAAAASRLSSILDGIPDAPAATAAPAAAPAAKTADASPELAWEVTADAAGRTYYYNTVTSETAWELPVQMAQIAEYARYYNVTLQQARYYMQQPAANGSARAEQGVSRGAGSQGTAGSGSGGPQQAAGGGGGEAEEEFASLMAEAAAEDGAEGGRGQASGSG